MLAGLVLAALVASAVAAGRWGRPAAPVLALCSLAWLTTSQRRMEGKLLWELSRHHGLVAADLAGLAGLALAVVVWAFPRRP